MTRWLEMTYLHTSWTSGKVSMHHIVVRYEGTTEEPQSTHAFIPQNMLDPHFHARLTSGNDPHIVPTSPPFLPPTYPIPLFSHSPRLKKHKYRHSQPSH